MGGFVSEIGFLPSSTGGFSQPKSVSLPDYIANTISDAIAIRRLKPGDRIVELALVDRLGVSRVPIREALKVLHAQGILVGGAHRGYRVADIDSTTIRQVLEIRLKLETILLRDAIEKWRSGKGNVEVLDEPIKAMEVAAKIGDMLASLNADLKFHQAFCESAGNEIAMTLWRAIARHVMIIFSQDEYRDKDLAAVVRQHQELRDFIAECVTNGCSEKVVTDRLTEHLLQVARRKKA
jgi:DNA-binding GntR family transcriptional regulator